MSSSRIQARRCCKPRPNMWKDLRHTVMTLLGIDSNKEYPDSQGRPVPLTDEGKMIPGLV
jgi:hypothetical protein